jgi:VanZ family protein
VYLRRSAARALVPLALMGWIYFLSAQPDLNSGLGIIDLIGRKVIHALTYFSLTIAWWWALAPSQGSWRALALAAAIAFLYACSDEYHQHFVEGRHGSPVDVAIDSLGIAAAIVFVRRGAWRRFARSNRPDGAPPPA